MLSLNRIRESGGLMQGGTGVGRYPLQKQFILIGIGSAFIAGGFGGSWLVGFSFFVFFASVGLLWRRDEIPVLSFCVGYQWLFVIAGYLYFLKTGKYPGFFVLGDLPSAVTFGLWGILFLAIGVRCGLRLGEKNTFGVEGTQQTKEAPYSIKRLFWIVIVVYTINWIMNVSPMQMLFNVAQLIYRIFEFRGILLVILFLEILVQRRGYRYGIVAFLYVWLPSFTSQMSAFSQIFFLIFLVLLSRWKPWEKEPEARARNWRLLVSIVLIVSILLGMALLWQGGIKPIWRFIVLPRIQGASQITKMQTFIDLVAQAGKHVNLGYAWESLVHRLSSEIAFFSFVLERVPKIVPHENGALTKRALTHVVQPRFLFPGKGSLGSDSWLIWRYAGLAAAGDKQGASVGLGYLPEFYVDFGVQGMFIAVFLYGFIVGAIYGVFCRFRRYPYLVEGGCAVIFLQHFTSYGGEIAKLLGGLFMSAILFVAILHFWGEVIDRKLRQE